MSLTSKILATLAVIAAAVAVVVWFGVFREPTPEPVAQPTSTEPEVETASVRTNGSSFFTRPGTKVVRTTTAMPVVEAPVATTNVMADWEDRVDKILGDDTETDEKARKMLELFPNFPEVGQVEVAGHIANLLADEDYEKFGKYLSDPKSPVAVQDTVLADVLNRPNTIKLPLLLETARNPDNAKAGEAKEMLELYLEEDYGPDWKNWEQPMNDYLKENPD